MKFEVVVIPCPTSIAQAFLRESRLRLDADFADGDDYRVIQFTPPGFLFGQSSARTSPAAAPGSAQASI